MQEVSHHRNTGRLASLWEIMNLFRAIKLTMVSKDIEKYRNKCQAALKKTAQDIEHAYTNALVPFYGATLPTQSIAESTIEICSFLDSEVKPLCEELKLINAKQTTLAVVNYLRRKDSHIDMSSLDADLRNIESALMRDCFKIAFVQIDPSLMGYLEKESLLGSEVQESFKSAAEDIKNAGNCIAVGLPTAAVFHLMCVVEWGLRAFAIDLGLLEVSVGRKNNRTKPIEYAQWEQILNQLSEKIKIKIESIAELPQKQQAQEFYWPAKEEFEAFRDAWRIHVMHAHRSYNLEDAIAVFSHVNRFMNLLLRIPTQTGHLLRLKPAIEYDPKRPPIMMNPATPERA